MTFTVCPALTVIVLPSSCLATDANPLYEGFRAPDGSSRPLCHGLPLESRNVNQMNICTFGSFFAIVSACFA